MAGPTKPPSLPQVKVDFNKAAGHQPPKTPPPPALKLNPPRPAAQAPAPAPGMARVAPAVKGPAAKPAAVQARAAAAKAPPKKPPMAAPGGIKTPVKPTVALKVAAGGNPAKNGPQPAAQAQMLRALSLKRDFARAAVQRKNGRGKTQEKQHTKSK